MRAKDGEFGPDMGVIAHPLSSRQVRKSVSRHAVVPVPSRRPPVSVTRSWAGATRRVRLTTVPSQVMIPESTVIPFLRACPRPGTFSKRCSSATPRAAAKTSWRCVAARPPCVTSTAEPGQIQVTPSPEVFNALTITPSPRRRVTPSTCPTLSGQAHGPRPPMNPLAPAQGCSDDPTDRTSARHCHGCRRMPAQHARGRGPGLRRRLRRCHG